MLGGSKTIRNKCWPLGTTPASLRLHTQPFRLFRCFLNFNLSQNSCSISKSFISPKPSTSAHRIVQRLPITSQDETAEEYLRSFSELSETIKSRPDLYAHHCVIGMAFSLASINDVQGQVINMFQASLIPFAKVFCGSVDK